MADRGRVDARDATGLGAVGGLVATGLTLRRDGRTVLQDASLTVPRGCVTALIAPSGAGKSTLLRCLNRLLDPDEGTITIGGEDVRAIDPRALRRRVGLVAQHPVMLPGTVHANVGYGLHPGHRGSDRIAPALAAAGLPGDWADRIAHDLSGGEQARVAIARAIVLDPEFLLLDEPTSALDERSAALVGDTLRRLADRGIGVCLATHDLGFAETFADRTARLEARA